MGMRSSKGPGERKDVEGKALARLKTHGERFEIIVDPENAYAYKMGQEVEMDDILEGDIIFKHAYRGEKASEELLQEIFETTDTEEIASQILKKGELQLTSEQRSQMAEEKRKQIINIITRNAVNPQTGLPHPPQRIENALQQASVPIDPLKDAASQAKEVIKALMPIIPIRMEQVVIALKFPPEFAGKAYGIVESFAEMEKQEWGTDGSWMVRARVPGGMAGPFLEKINEFTKGKAQTKIVDRLT
jgi:ribosome maturation protein SDO1